MPTTAAEHDRQVRSGFTPGADATTYDGGPGHAFTILDVLMASRRQTPVWFTFSLPHLESGLSHRLRELPRTIPATAEYERAFDWSRTSDTQQRRDGKGRGRRNVEGL